MTRLDGVGVLITRPAGRAGSLVNAITAAGGEAIEFPVLDIELEPSPALLRPGDKPLENNALVIFVSVYAVRALEAVLASGAALPGGAVLAAIGPATTRALEALGLSPSISPEGDESSEGLLRALNRLNLVDRQVLILRGQSGRELLSRELQQRGARVVQLSCYRRNPVSAPPMNNFRRWLSFPEGVATITSVAIMEALLEVVADPDRSRLTQRPVVTLSERIRSACRRSGFTGPIEVAQGSDTESMFTAIQRVRDVSDSG